MKKYELSQLFNLPQYFKYTAGTKARIDADNIYRQNGFEIIYLPDIKQDKFFYWLIRRFFLGLSFLRIERDSEVHIQFPASGVIRWIIRVLRFRSIKVTLLVHDLDYIRENDRKRRKKEIRTFNLADELIVHTPAMADELKKQGVRVPLKILILFDYLTSINDVYKEPDIHSVVFAGNIRKSDFVELLINNDIWNIKTFMYGVNNLEYPENSNFHYKGIFTSEDISQIKGAWGLVWDGDSIETCSSNKGLYLRYNSSHKISLYLVAEKPVIVWSQSSLRYFVEEQGIGIVVDSLLDIPELLSGITETHYREYVENVKKISEKLRAGAFLSSCLQS